MMKCILIQMIVILRDKYLLINSQFENREGASEERRKKITSN